MILGFGAGRCGTKTLAQHIKGTHEIAKTKLLNGMVWGVPLEDGELDEILKKGDVGLCNLHSVEKAIQKGAKIVYLTRERTSHVKSWKRFIDLWDGYQLWQDKETNHGVNLMFPTYPKEWSLDKCINTYLDDYDKIAQKLIKKYPEIITFKMEDLSDLSKLKELYKKLDLKHKPEIIQLNQNTYRKNAVFVACGKNSIHGIYNTKDKNYDIIQIAYEDCEKNGDIYYRKDGYKFNLIYDWFQENINIGHGYERFLFLDDDILLSTQEINQIFDYAEKYELKIFHPAMNPKNFDHAPIMYKQDNSIIHTQNWTEICAVGFNKKTLYELLPSFITNKSGWGLPNIWNGLGYTFDIIDEVEGIHTKPMNSGEFYSKLGKVENPNPEMNGMDLAYKEFQEIIKMYPQKEFELYRKIYKKPVLSIFSIYHKENERYLKEYIECLPKFTENIIIKTVPISEAREYIKDGLAPKLYEAKIEIEKPIKTGIMFVPDEDPNFAKMKNAAKELCNSEWVLNLDIDERLLNHQFNMLREWIEKPEHHRNVGGYYVTNLSVMPAAINEAGIGSRVAVPATRLFRKKFNYEDAIHETPDREIKKEMKIMDSTLIIHHKGYEVTREELKKKAERNLRGLFRKEYLNKKEKWDYLINTAAFYKQLGG